MSIEALLIPRVHTIYNDKCLGIVSVFGSAQCAAMGISARMVVPSLGSSPTCIVIGTHPGQIYVGVLSLVTLTSMGPRQSQMSENTPSNVMVCSF
ncbi:hypothetical protein AZE42_10359 [Rhizopogon vesiculosus]|uniref:Uncharacterized protein n=1 Tax=Rhizopogon vesiculosus TaxID=180088 RepID=A0A1J8PZW4_9AGAM|nr:hypothetical protein AZE42_10359 [Rhizopogon vesiculosus]